RVTIVPWLNLAWQVPPQVMPPGLLVTVPPPVPSLFTFSVCCTTSGLKVAVASLSAVIVTSHSLEPLTVPGQPLAPQLTAVEPAFGVPCSLTRVPWLKLASQLPVVQLIPAGLLVTVPPPEPARVTFSLCCSRLKVAVTCFASVIVTWH